MGRTYTVGLNPTGGTAGLPLSPRLKTNQFCVFIHVYHPCNPPILDILKDNWKILECTPTLKCISDKQPKLGFRHNPKLRDLLVHLRTPHPPQNNTHSACSTPKPSKVCLSTNCHYCPHLDTICTSWNFVTNQKHIVPSRISCKLNNLVYLFTCTCCLQYVGETSRNFATTLHFLVNYLYSTISHF